MSDAHPKDGPNDGEDSTSYLYAWISRDEDGVEGLILMPTANGPLPLISTSRSQALSLFPAAQVAAQARGNPSRLVRFERNITIAVAEVNWGWSRPGPA